MNSCACIWRPPVGWCWLRRTGATRTTVTCCYRNYAERAKGAAILSALAGFWSEELRTRCRREAAKLVGEVAAVHRKRPSFGNEWQGALFSAEAGMAAWFLWDELDPTVRRDVAEMVVYQADRLAATKPKMGFRGDTQAETVAWNSAALTVAVNMMPAHPHVARWNEAVKTYLYNTFAAPQDAQDESPGDDGTPVNRWILGANIHEDFALENHNQFHMDYLLACYRFHVLGAAMYQVARKPLPRAIHHHARDVYEKVMLRCMNRDGFFQYVSDNDWRRYHAWTESATVHAYLAFLEKDPLAAALESRACAKQCSIGASCLPAGAMTIRTCAASPGHHALLRPCCCTSQPQMFCRRRCPTISWTENSWEPVN